MPVEVWTNDGVGTVTAGGTTAPVAGTIETWTVTVTTAFPSATTTGPTQFYVCDSNVSTATEKILVTVAPGGTGAGQTWTVTRGADGSSPVTHTGGFTIVQVVTGSSLRALQAGVAWQVLPSGDTTGATDWTNITAALAATSKAVLAPGNYWVNQTIQLAGNSTIVGAMPIQFGTSRLFMATGANLAAVIASAGWTTSTNANSTAPVFIRDLLIDANGANQSGGAGHGLVLQTFGSYIEDVIVQNTLGDGFRIDFFGANGTSGIANTAVENRFHRCKVISAGANGFNTTDPISTAAITDGFITDCIINGVGSGFTGILLAASAGWMVRGCHVYGLNASGIVCQRPFSTRIIGNYIEPFGTNAAAHFYAGISAQNAQDQNAAIIVGNTVRMLAVPGNVGSTIIGIDCETGNGQTAGFTVTGNQVYCNQATATRYGIYIQNDNAAATTNSVTTGNNVVGTFTAASPFLVANGGTLNHTAGV